MLPAGWWTVPRNMEGAEVGAGAEVEPKEAGATVGVERERRATLIWRWRRRDSTKYRAYKASQFCGK